MTQRPESFRKLLVFMRPGAAIDGAFKEAHRLATAHPAHVTVACVLEALSDSVDEYFPGGSHRPDQKTEAHEHLTALISSVDWGKTRVTPKVLVGEPSRALVREVLENGHDIVLKTAENEESLLGAIATRLMRVCPCPVYIIHPSKTNRPRRILAAIDASVEEPEEKDLQVKVLRTANDLRNLSTGGELHVLHVLDGQGEQFLRGRVSSSQLSSYFTHSNDIARTDLSSLISESEASLSDEHIHLRRGRPEEAILDFSRKESMDLVVLGTVARTGVSGFFIGNTAEKVLRRIPCSVLGVKPDGFRCPIK